jgi:(S)-ureidoglycine aminohydrolase
MVQTDLAGITRDVVKVRYALLTPAGVVPSYLPGWEKAACKVLISPALGAQFSQLLITLEHDGQCVGNTGTNQYFIYVLEGNAGILLDERRHRLEPGSYVYLPAGKDVQLKSAAAATRVLVFQKKYEALPGVARPTALVGHEREVKGQPLAGSEAVRLQALLPDHPAFDLAVNIFTYQPGTTLPHVETHVMEHGLLMLRGQGIYRLEEDWHPVQAGDAIWVAPYCPQWFVGIGKTPASYLCYKDTNRDPM